MQTTTSREVGGMPGEEPTRSAAHADRSAGRSMVGSLAMEPMRRRSRHRRQRPARTPVVPGKLDAEPQVAPPQPTLPRSRSDAPSPSLPPRLLQPPPVLVPRRLAIRTKPGRRAFRFAGHKQPQLAPVINVEPRHKFSEQSVGASGLHRHWLASDGCSEGSRRRSAHRHAAAAGASDPAARQHPVGGAAFGSRTASRPGPSARSSRTTTQRASSLGRPRWARCATAASFCRRRPRRRRAARAVDAARDRRPHLLRRRPCLLQVPPRPRRWAPVWRPPPRPA